MRLGSEEICLCPNCKEPFKFYAVISGNTFGSRLFSDGKWISPSLPETPNITKCHKCNHIFWIQDILRVKDYKISERLVEEVKNIKGANSPILEDLIFYQKNVIDLSFPKETVIRIKIWWLFNDRMRNGYPLLKTPEEGEFLNENSIRLIVLLTENFRDNIIQIAELNRNLGLFENCKDIILKSKASNWIKNSFLNECERENKYVFELIR